MNSQLFFGTKRIVDEWNLPWTGGCPCRAIRFRVDKPPLLGWACHCRGCRIMTKSAYSLVLTVPTDGFEIVRGTPVLGGLAAAKDPEASGDQMFCGACHTWLYTVVPAMDWFVNLRVPNLDEHAWFVPFVDMQRAQGFDWARTPARHSFAGSPPFEEYGKLAAAYAAEGVRPPPRPAPRRR